MSIPDQHTDIPRPGSEPPLDGTRPDEPRRNGTHDDPTRNAGTGAARDHTSDTAGGDRVTRDRSGAENAGGRGSGTDTDGRERLVSAERVDSYGSRWDAIKGTFVDEPRRAVVEADALVDELLKELETLFREQRRDIEHGLDADETSTEELRLALRRYRSFFDRLLTL